MERDFLEKKEGNPPGKRGRSLLSRPDHVNRESNDWILPQRQDGSGGETITPGSASSSLASLAVAESLQLG
jgi:hypothetical protein